MIRIIVYGLLSITGAAWALSSGAAAGCFFVLTYLVNPQILAPVFGTFRLQMISILILFVMALTSKPRQGRNWSHGILLPLILFAIYCFLSTSWAVIDIKIAYSAAVEFAKTVFGAVLLSLVIRTKQDVRWLMWALIFGVFHGAMLHVIGTKFGYVPQRFAQEYGVFSDEHAGVLLVLFPIVVIHAFYADSTSSRAFCWGVLGIVIVSIVNTYRRAPLVGIAAEAVVLFILIPKTKIVRFAPVLLLLLATIGIRSTPENWWERMGTILTPTQEGSANSRFIIQKAYWRMAMDYPLGVGYRNSPWVARNYLPEEMMSHNGGRSAHNTYYAILTETGFLGLALWSVVWFGSLWLLFQMIYATEDIYLQHCAIGLLAGLVGWSVAGWAISYNQMDPAYWFIGIAVGIRRLQLSATNRNE